MRFLKESTSVVVCIGPFLDKTDGVTPETGVTGSPEVCKAGGTTFTAVTDTVTAIAGGDGYYEVTLDTDETDTVGPLLLQMTDATTHLPVWHEFQVIETAIYDAFFASGAAWGLNANVSSMSSNVITASAIQSNAIGSSELANNAISASVFDAEEEVANAVLDKICMFNGNVAAVSTQTIMELNVDSTSNDQWNGMYIMFIDVSSSQQRNIRRITDTVQSASPSQAQITLDSACDFTVVVGDEAYIFPQNPIFYSLANATRDANMLDQFRTVHTMVEHQRGSHTGQPIGNIYYVDPTNGDTHANGNRGGISDPYAGVQDCHDNAVTDSNHDVIILLSGASAGPTTLTEDVTLSKRYLFVRGPGRDFIWTRSGGGDTISITADGIELSGFQINTAATGSGVGVQITDADFIRIHNCWINDTRGDGVSILRGENCMIHDNVFIDSGQSGTGHGIEVDGSSGSSNYNHIYDNHFRDCQGDSIRISGGTTNNTFIERNQIEGSTDNGILIGSSSTDAFVAYNNIGNSTTSDINDGGTTTVLIGNSAGVDVVKISSSATAADNLEETMETVTLGAISDGSPSATSFDTDLSSTNADEFNGKVLVFRNDATMGVEATLITDYDGAGILTVEALSQTPPNGALFAII